MRGRSDGTYDRLKGNVGQKQGEPKKPTRKKGERDSPKFAALRLTVEKTTTLLRRIMLTGPEILRNSSKEDSLGTLTCILKGIPAKVPLQ